MDLRYSHLISYDLRRQAVRKGWARCGKLVTSEGQANRDASGGIMRRYVIKVFGHDTWWYGQVTAATWEDAVKLACERASRICGITEVVSIEHVR
jgi:hypothetical protein